jgi:hypothetical protein
MDEPKHGQGGVSQRREAFGKTGTFGIVTVFIPPTVLDEVQAVFHLPVPTNIGVKSGCRDRAWIEAGHEIAAIVEKKLAGRRTDFPIGAEQYLAVGNVQTLAQIVGIAQVEPEQAGFAATPLFSVTTWAGRPATAAAKQVRSASSISGWLPFT